MSLFKRLVDLLFRIRGVEDRAVGRWIRILVDALTLYALFGLGAPTWLLVALGVGVGVSAYLEFRARMQDDDA